MVRLACQRFLADLERDDLRFNKDRAERFCEFIELLPHVKGRWSGKLLRLEPWQSFLIVNLFGFEVLDGLRRFRRAFVFVPRKNGKTFLAAAIGLGMLTIEAEPGSEVYCGATSEAQADEVFRPAKAMAERAAGFKRTFGVTVAASAIYRESGLSFFKKLIGRPGEGQSPYCAIHDEYHEHKTSEQVDAMDTGMGARQEPLQFIITTAGVDISSPCKELYDYACAVLEGNFVNDRFFALLYGADPEDDWTDFNTWIKANPNYGVSVFEDYLRGKLEEAVQRTAVQNQVKTKHLNLWCNTGTAWINMARWNENADRLLRIEDFAGSPAWIGIDLASKVDLTAMMVLIYHQARWYVFGKYYLPEETVQQKQNTHYQRWVLDGWLTQTPGARTDYEFLLRDLRDLYSMLSVQEIVYDPREAEYLMQRVREHVSCPVVEMLQTATALSEPMKEFEAEYLTGNLLHNGDPVLAWAASNVVLRQAQSKLYYPTKPKVEQKIDPIVALLMALGRAKATTKDVAEQAFVEL
jgi:phage terminase large subunit-like protein